MVLNRRILMLSVRLAFGYCFTGFKTDAFKEWRGSQNYLNEIEKYKFNKYDLVKPLLCIDDEMQIRFLKNSTIGFDLYSGMIPVGGLEVPKDLENEVIQSFEDMLKNEEFPSVFRDRNNWNAPQIILNVSS